MRDAVRVALTQIAARFSDDAPSIDAQALRSRYSALASWPADSQLGLVVLAWVLGSGFRMGRFRESVNTLVPDFLEASKAVSIGDTPTLITLSGIVRCAFSNGATVLRWNLDPEILYWPLNLSGTLGATGSLGAPTPTR